MSALYDKKTLKKGTFFPTHTYLLLLTRDSYETKMYLSVLTEIKWNEIKLKHEINSNEIILTDTNMWLKICFYLSN